LATARARAVKNAQLITEGGDPRAPVATIPTFADAAEIVIGIHAEGWKDGGRQAGIWRSSLERYAYPTIGGKLVSDVTTADVMTILAPEWTAKRETMMRLRRRMSAIFKWAVAQEYRADNPAGDSIGAALPKTGARVTHQRALPHVEVAGAIATIRDSGAWPATKLAFELLVLTATRSGETRLATWDEIDLDNRVWEIPAERTKTGNEHRVPLADAALDVLTAARELSDSEGLIFPSPRGKALSDATISKLVRENGIAAVPHGMRSSFRDWCGDNGVAREVAEACLAHEVGGVEGAYFRSDLFERRRDVMDQWASYVAPASE
jgi:integrase